MQTIFVYITTKDIQQAKLIGKSLVKERLAACVNIIDGMQSIYWWEGEVNEDNETVLIAKTGEQLLQKVIERVKELHSYSVPCIVALPVIDGNKEYLKWINGEINSKS